MKATSKQSVKGLHKTGLSKHLFMEHLFGYKKRDESFFKNKVGANRTPLVFGSVLLSALFMINTSCDRLLEEIPMEESHGVAFDPSYLQVNLVSDTLGFNAMRIDNNLVNAWGIAINPSGIFWISANDAGLSVVYDQNGLAKRPPVTIPFQSVADGGNPTGQVFNNTSDFVIDADTLPAKFIFATENGTITAWNKGNSAVTVVDRSGFGSVYKGLALANDGMANFLFAADFFNAKIDVFDKNFNLVTSKPFIDNNIPSGFAPFNIRLLDGKLYVTYAKQLAPENHDDEKGPGNGYIDIFDLNGLLIKRFASRGVLNSPWGIEKSAPGFGQGKDAILVGNFGDGHINVFNKQCEFVRPLKNHDKPIAIEGLWAITFPDGNVMGADPNHLYFTAGPNDESHGVFGYLQKK